MLEMETKERTTLTRTHIVNRQSFEVTRGQDSIVMRIFGHFLTLLSFLCLLSLFPLSLFVCLEVINQFETIVVFRHGRLKSGKGSNGPGVVLILPCVDTYRIVDLRVQTLDVLPQKILTKDAISCEVDAVIHYHVFDAIKVVKEVREYSKATGLLAQTVLRNVFGTKNLSQILSETKEISELIRKLLIDMTHKWGVRVERVDVKNVRLPQQMQRAMAVEAEALREARAKVIDAEAEHEASFALNAAAEVLSSGGDDCAIQLRLLQTLSTIAVEQNRTVVLPFPIELFVWDEE